MVSTSGPVADRPWKGAVYARDGAWTCRTLGQNCERATGDGRAV